MKKFNILLLLLLLKLNIFMYTCKYVNPDNRSTLLEDIVDLPGLRNRPVEQLCVLRQRSAGWSDRTTDGPTCGPTWRACRFGKSSCSLSRPFAVEIIS